MNTRTSIFAALGFALIAHSSPLQAEQELVLPWLQARGTSRLFAEREEPPDLVTQFRQCFIVRQGECFHAADYIAAIRGPPICIVSRYVMKSKVFASRRNRTSYFADFFAKFAKNNCEREGRMWHAPFRSFTILSSSNFT